MRWGLLVLFVACGGRVGGAQGDASVAPEASAPTPPRCPESRPSSCQATSPTVLAETGRDVYHFALDRDHVYWSEPATRLVRRVAKSGGSPETVVLSPDAPGALTVDASRVYFRAGEDVRFVPSGGGDYAILTSSVKSSAALADDDANVYWPSSSLWSAPKAGGPARALALVDKDAPRNASRTPSDGEFVYFATYTSGLYRVPVGGGPSELLTPKRGYSPIVDCSNVYFARDPCNQGQNGIYSLPKGGGEATLFSPSALGDCSWQLGGIAEDSDAVYWSERGATTGNVWRSPKAGGASALIEQDAKPGDVGVDDRCVYWIRVLDTGFPTTRSEIVAAPIPR